MIIINADKIVFTGNKRLSMRYFAHSTHPGGWRNLTVDQVEAARPGFPVSRAIKGMLPHTVLGKHMGSKLHVYVGTKHPHEAQKPEVLDFK